MVRVGWYFRTPSGVWRAGAADGYAITTDGAIATCYHCLEENEPGVTDAYLFAATDDLEIHRVTAVLAADPVLDVAIIRVEGADFSPIALNDQIAPGDSAYLLSDPNRLENYFTTGQVNRFYWRRPGKNDRNTLEGVRNLRINVSTDWSPGSSGAAVLDHCGNAIGHVSTINAINRSATEHLFSENANTAATTQPAPTTREARAPATYIVLHEAVPARGVRLLAESMNAKERPQ
jgi:S1-C subfamily serine protease